MNIKICVSDEGFGHIVRQRVIIKEILRQFVPSVGFPDRTSGTEAAKGAIAIGVDVSEKHLMLSKYLSQAKQTTSMDTNKKPTTIHKIAIEYDELKEIYDYAK